MRTQTTLKWARATTMTLAALGSLGCGARSDLEGGGWELSADPARDPQVDPGVDPVDPIDPTDPVVVDPIDEPALGSPLAACDLEQIWWQPDPTHRLTPQVFEISPSEHVLMRGGETFGDGFGMLRMSSGELMTTYSSSRIHGLDASWGRALQRGQDAETGAPTLRVVSGDRTRTIFEVPGASYQLSAVLSRDGRRVGVTECTTDEDGSQAGVELTLWDVDDATSPVSQTLLAGRSCSWYAPETIHMSLTPSGDAFAYVDISREHDGDGLAPAILTLMREDGSVLEAEVPQDPIEDTRGQYYGVISSLGFTPDGGVSVVSAEGLRATFDANLRELSTERRGAFVSNPDTYMPPLPMSPTRWTQRGDVEASTAPDGAVELRDPSGEVISRIFAPEPSDIAEWSEDAAVENAPVMVTFSEDGSMVAIGFRKGVGLWGCPSALPTPPAAAERTVELDAPSSAALGEPIPLEFAVSGQAASDWSVYKLIVNGDLRSSWLDPSEIDWRHYEPGRVTVELEVDDGWTSTRSAPRVVEITN